MEFYHIDISTYNSSGHCTFNLSSKWTSKNNVQKLCNIASKYFLPDKITVHNNEYELELAESKPNHFRLDDYTTDDLIEFENIISRKQF